MLASGKAAPSWETIVALLILIGFVSVNFAVATRTPTVVDRPDEPQHCDPAANLYFGKGFTSTLWGQGRTEFCACNDPLYQGIQFCFFKIFGFSFFKARALNTMLAAVSGLLLWSSLRRTGLVQRPSNRLLSLALVLSGSLSTLTFRTIRYDTTMFFISSLLFFACSLSARGPGRYAMVLLFSVLLLAAGLPMLPYWAALLTITLIVYRSTYRPLLIAISAGLISGAAGLVCFYACESSLRAFLHIAMPSTALSRQANLLTKITGTPTDPDNLLTCFFGNPTEFLDPKVMFDYSAVLLFVLFCLMAASVWKSADAQTRKFIIFIITVTLAVPPFMHLAGHYRSYYRWMTYIPLCIAVPRMIEIQQSLAPSPFVRRVVSLGICLSLFMGVPLRTLAALPTWSQRSPGPLNRVAAQLIHSSDVAVCDYKVYFAIRPRVELLYAYGITATGEFSRTRDLPTNDITVLCLTPKSFQAVTNRIGGKWEQVSMRNVAGAEALKKTRYAVDFYRRPPAAKVEQ